MREVIWGTDMETESLTSLQRKVVTKIDSFTVLTGEIGVTGTGALSAAYQGPSQSAADAKSDAGSMVSDITKIV